MAKFQVNILSNMFLNRATLFHRMPKRLENCTYATEAKLKCEPYKRFRIDSEPNSESTFTRDSALHTFTQMATIRRIEGTLANLYKAKFCRGFCHLYSGEEAIAVGIKSCLSDKDTVITAYRCHGWTYLMGTKPIGVISELMGRESGCARGKGGSMHMYTHTFYGGNGIVGAHVPIGTGLGLKHKYTNDGAISVVCYGDGAANQGQVFEAFNFAKLQMLPILYVCENNRYGMGTSAVRSSANPNYYTRGDYIPGIWVDGMDVVSVKEATEFAKKYIAEGKGPIIVEMYTYRYYGHSMSDPGTSYRTREEIKQVRETSDPINKFKKKILDAQLVEESDLKKIEAEIKKEIEGVAEEGKKHPEVPLVELTSDIYSSNLFGKIRSVIYDQPGEHKRIGDAVNFK